MALPGDMRWRYAVQRFVPGLRSGAALEAALEAARLAPSSFGLQPWRILNIEGDELRQALVPLAYGQDKVAQAGHLLIFASRAPLLPEDIDAHVDRVAAARALDDLAREKLTAKLARDVLGRHDAAGLDAWCRAQCYLGLGVFLAACASLRLDACPMEGFQPDAVADLLELRPLRLEPRVLVAVGARDPADPAAAGAKVRPDPDDLILTLGA